MRKTRLRLESLDERAVPSATTTEPPPDGGTGQTPQSGNWMTVAADTPTYLGSDNSGNAYYLTGTSDGDLWVTAVDATGFVSNDLVVGTSNARTGQLPLPPGVYPVPGPGWDGEPLARPHPSGGWGTLDPVPPGTRYAPQPGWTYYQSPKGTVYGYPPGQDPYAPRPPASPPPSAPPLPPRTRPPATPPANPQPVPNGPIIIGPGGVYVGPGGVYVGPGGTYNGAPRPVPTNPPPRPVPPGTPPPRVEEERTLPSGATQVRRPDGSVTQTWPDGVVEEWDAAGNYTIRVPRRVFGQNAQ